MCSSPPPPKLAVPEFSSHAGGQAGAQASGSCPLLARVHTWHFSKSLRCYSPAHLLFSSWYKTTFMWLPINGDQRGDSDTADTAAAQAHLCGVPRARGLGILADPLPTSSRGSQSCLLLLVTGGPVRHNRWLLGTGKRGVHRTDGLGLKGIVSRVENLTSSLRNEDTEEAF